MMHDTQKSDAGIVAAMSTNKGEPSPAESTEPRPATKRNPQSDGAGRTHRAGHPALSGAERIRQFARANPKEKLTALLHHINPESLQRAFDGLKPKAAPGVDGITWHMYEEGLTARLRDLADRVHKGAYRATPVRRVEIPKPGGGVRKLGIAALEDKIVQRAVADNLLNPIYETSVRRI